MSSHCERYMWMDMESKIDEVVDVVSAYQVFDVAETRREAPPRRKCSLNRRN